MKKHYSLLVALLFSMISCHANASENEELADIECAKKLCIDADRSAYSPEVRKHLGLSPTIQHLALDDVSPNFSDLFNQIRRKSITLLPFVPVETAASSSLSVVSRAKSPSINDQIYLYIYSRLDQLGQLHLLLPKLRDNLNSLVGVSRLERFFYERLRILSNQLKLKKSLKQSRKQSIILTEIVEEEAKTHPKPVSLINVEEFFQAREDLPLQITSSGLWDQIVQYTRKNPKKIIAGGVFIAAIVGGTIVYYLQPTKQKEHPQFGNYSNFTIYFPSNFHRTNGWNVAVPFDEKSETGKQIESSRFGKFSEYSGYEGELRIVDVARMINKTQLKEPNYILAQCTRFCTDTVNFFIEATSGIVCQQISDLVFGGMFDNSLEYLVPKGNYSVPMDQVIENRGNVLPSKCPDYMQYKY
jgi:hypothetical protein